MFVVVLIFIGTALKSQQTLEGLEFQRLLDILQQGQASVHFSPPQARWHQIRVQIRSKPGANLKPKYFRQSELRKLVSPDTGLARVVFADAAAFSSSASKTSAITPRSNSF
uniref:FtsH_ext domain-containing protein n=1 Tax=Macrostomum lignano TaxID=282301 RepID=A0A1I8JMI8_9PLAT